MTKKPYVVVTGTDFSKEASRALSVAYAQARRDAPAELHVLHAVFAVDTEQARRAAPVPALSVQIPRLDELQTQLLTHLETVLGPSARTNDAVRIVAHVAVEIPSVALTQFASELEADLLVVGTHGLHGVARWILGSVTEGVVRSATCPVLVVPPAVEQLPVPQIEPPCPRCVAARRASAGAELWCEQHRERHGRRHTYYQTDRLGAETNPPLVVRET